MTRRKKQGNRRHSPRFEELDLSAMEEHPEDHVIDLPQQPAAGQGNNHPVPIEVVTRPTGTSEQALERPYHLRPRADSRSDSLGQGTQTSAEDTIAPGNIPSVWDMHMLSSTFNRNSMSGAAKDALTLTDFMQSMSQRVDQLDVKIDLLSQAIIQLTTSAVTKDAFRQAIDTVCSKIERTEQNLQDRVTMIDDRVVELELQHNRLTEDVRAGNSQADVLQGLASQIEEVRAENESMQSENAATKNAIDKVHNTTVELGKLLTSAQVVLKTTLKHTAKIAHAVATVPAIRAKLWTREDIRNWTPPEPPPENSPSLGESMRRNDAQLSQLVQEVPRVVIGEQVPMTTSPVGLSHPAHHSSNADGELNPDRRDGEITEIWRELGRLGGCDASQQLASSAGSNNFNNHTRIGPQENLIALEKLARARNLVFPEEETQPKIYLRELTDFKEEQQISDKEALGLVKALFAKNHAQWLRLNSGRWTTWKHFVDAYAAYFIHPRADPEINAEIYDKYQVADQEARVFIDEMQKLFMEMTTPPMEEIQIQIISQRLSKQLQAELKTRQTKATEYIGFRLAVNLAVANLRYLGKAYDENERCYVRKKTLTPNRVTQTVEIIQIPDAESEEDRETTNSSHYVNREL